MDNNHKDFCKDDFFILHLTDKGVCKINMENCIFCHTEYNLKDSDSISPACFCTKKCEKEFDESQKELRSELRRIREKTKIKGE